VRIRIRDPESFFYPGFGRGKIRIWNKHPESATLNIRYQISLQKKYINTYSIWITGTGTYRTICAHVVNYTSLV
jgi:hypothetical protein